MRESDREEMTQLGLYGLIPFAIGAAAAWLTPWLVPGSVAYDIGEVTLIYGAVVASYIAGVGAGAILTSPKGDTAGLMPPMIAALVAWITAFPPGAFFITLPVMVRYLIMIGVFAYFYLRDQRAVEAGELPNWYAPLRTRLTFWACLLLALVVVRYLL